MKETLKRKIILFLITTIIVAGIINVAYGVYFGVLTNVLINAFWNSKLFPEKKIKQKPERKLIIESIKPPTF